MFNMYKEEYKHQQATAGSHEFFFIRNSGVLTLPSYVGSYTRLHFEDSKTLEPSFRLP
jgi:hypothetical protein